MRPPGAGRRRACVRSLTLRTSRPVKGRQETTGVTDTHRSPPASCPGLLPEHRAVWGPLCLQTPPPRLTQPGHARVACRLLGGRKVTPGANTPGGRGCLCLADCYPGAWGSRGPCPAPRQGGAGGRAGAGGGRGAGAWPAGHWHPEASGRLWEGDG